MPSAVLTSYQDAGRAIAPHPRWWEATVARRQNRRQSMPVDDDAMTPEEISDVQKWEDRLMRDADNGRAKFVALDEFLRQVRR